MLASQLSSQEEEKVRMASHWILIGYDDESGITCNPKLTSTSVGDVVTFICNPYSHLGDKVKVDFTKASPFAKWPNGGIHLVPGNPSSPFAVIAANNRYSFQLQDRKDPVQDPEVEVLPGSQY